jgi:hypothetical protein
MLERDGSGGGGGGAKLCNTEALEVEIVYIWGLLDHPSTRPRPRHPPITLIEEEDTVKLNRTLLSQDTTPPPPHSLHQFRMIGLDGSKYQKNIPSYIK